MDREGSCEAKITRNNSPLYQGCIRGVSLTFMKNLKSIFFASLITMVMAVWGPSPASAQEIGRSLPDFDFHHLDGQKTTLHKLHQESPNKTLLLTFWCTDCSSCRKSEKHLIKLLKEFEGKAEIVAISSSRNDDAARVKEYLSSHKLKLPVLMDPESRFAHHLKITRTTTSAILDKNGKVRYFGTLLRGNKYFARDSLKSLISGKIIGTPRGPSFG